MICRTSPYRTVLRDNAIPTIFDLTSHLNNPHSRHRKRIKELSEDEIRTLKQKKIDETSEQEQKHKETNNSNVQNPSAEEGGDEQDEDILPLTLEEKENKEYLKALRASLEMKCKCHGVSGSCSIRTCWKGLQELRDVAADLKTRYLSATKVVHRPMGTRKHLVPKDLDIRPVKDSELVYLQSSPDFCMKNEKVGSHGTQDRQCNKTSNGSDSCDLMCCGRGYNPYTDRVVERCHCKYHWCCYVTCRRCERTVERYVCK
ncbi:Protein Wnt-11 [Sciurus carolinensis]|uniref:Protein Wnt n=1 Tax=Sciurus carolinensis TaxID=30640 RepID=A0AA41SVM8_SCICA|nr:Protein Wnt-11 [Sciurus carolinensis]